MFRQYEYPLPILLRFIWLITESSSSIFKFDEKKLPSIKMGKQTDYRTLITFGELSYLYKPMSLPVDRKSCIQCRYATLCFLWLCFLWCRKYLTQKDGNNNWSLWSILADHRYVWQKIAQLIFDTKIDVDIWIPSKHTGQPKRKCQRISINYKE